MKTMIDFMNGGLGRAARVVLGVALIYVGLFTLSGSVAGYVVAIIGLAPIVLGFWGHCLLELVAPQAKHA
jgi:Inner membrane protein YgaP-like, transmembrane domain